MPDEIPIVIAEPKKSFWSHLGEFFQEGAGGFSMTRLTTFALVVIPILIWTAVSLYHWSLQELPASVVTSMGIGTAGKLLQKPLEDKPSA